MYKTKFDIRGRAIDVVICFKSYRNGLRGIRVVMGHCLWQSPLQQVSMVLPVMKRSYILSIWSDIMGLTARELS